MRHRRLLFGLGWGALLALTMCQGSTHITLDVSTNAQCSDLGSTTVSVGVLAELEPKPPTSAVTSCDSANGHIGDLVIVPSGDDDAEVAMKVVTGVRRNAEDCAPPDYKGCIVARRALRFVPNKETRVRIKMDLQCLDVPCGALDTCFKGRCVSARCIETNECPEDGDASTGTADGASADQSVVDTSTPDSADEDVTVADAAPDAPDAPADVTTDVPDGGVDAAPDAPIDAPIDAPVDASPDASDACVPPVCTVPCATRADCSPDLTCSPALRVCAFDTVAPHLESASLVAPDTVRVVYSEPVSGAATASAYCVETFDFDATTCTPTVDFTVASVTAIDTRTYDVKLSSAALAKRYTIKASNVVDGASNALGSPAYAELAGNEPFRVVGARSTSANTIELAFSAPVLGTANAANSAGCTSAVECAKRYKLVGASSLGAITSAVVSAPPRADRVVLTHATAQGGGLYTVVVANNTNGDGFDDAAFGSVRSTSAATLSAFPRDRALFMGAGAPINTIAQGPFASDVFADGTPTEYVFSYRGRVHVGQNVSGSAALRFMPEGDEPELLSFTFAKDTTVAGGGISLNALASTYTTIGAAGCVQDQTCGPDNENGRGRFTAATLGISPWLFLGGARSNGSLDYVYTTTDDDTALDFKYVDITNNTGGNTRGVTEIAGFGGRVYMGLPDVGGQRPYFVSLLQAPALGAPGLDAVVNGNGACVPGTHQSCDLTGDKLPAVGAQVSIDALYGFGASLYVANPGGLARSTTSTPLDATSAPSDWVTSTPSAAAYGAKTSLTSTKTADIRPSDKAWPSLATFGGKLYGARNTTAGPQLWRCDPTTVSGPAPATASDCDPGDWSLAAPNTVGDSQLTQLNTATHTRLVMLVVNGPWLYAGFETTTGVALYRSNKSTVASITDFEGAGGCVAGAVGCTPIGGLGLGLVQNTRFLDWTSASGGGKSFLYLVVGDGTAPARLYRIMD